MIPAPIPVPTLTTTTLSWPAATPGAPLPERQQVHVVVHPDRGVVARGEPLADRVAVPAGHDRRRDRPPGLELDRPRHADADAPQPAGDAGGRPEQRLEQRVDPVEAGLRAGLDRRRLVVMAEDPPVERGDRHVDARRPEVRDEDVAGVGAERQLARRPAAGARSDVALGDEPAVHELPDPLRDDRPPQPGPRDQLGPRPRPAEPDLVEDGDQRVERLVGERRVRLELHDGPHHTPSFVRSAVDFCT